MDTCESPIEEIIIDYLPERDDHEDDLHSCPICSRRFRSDVYQKHVVICEKTAAKKRKTFDSSRQRREGTDMALYLPKNFGLPEHKTHHVETKTLPIVKDLAQHSKQKIESTKEGTSPFRRDQSSVRQSKRNIQPISEQCPHCERCFGVKAFDRHVEWCEKKARLIVHSTPKSVNVAKEKLEARTKYKPPSLKSKRDLNREKYSGEMSCGTSMNSILSDFSVGKRSKSNSIERDRKSSVASMTSSITSDSQDEMTGISYGEELIRHDVSRNDISLSDMYLDLGLDKDETEKRIDDCESSSDRNCHEENPQEVHNKLDTSHYVLQETISSLKMKSQFQISKKEFFSRIGKAKPKMSPSQTRISNALACADKLTHQCSSTKIVANANSAYGSIQTNNGARMGTEMIKKKFDFNKKSNQMNLMSNTELTVQPYGFNNQSDSEKNVSDQKIFDDRMTSDTLEKKSDATGVCKRMREPIKLTQRGSSPCISIVESRQSKILSSPNFRPYRFRDSKMQLIQTSHSDDECEPHMKPKSLLDASSFIKKPTAKAICSKDEGSIVEMYTPRSVKCYTVLNENTNDGLDSDNIRMEMNIQPKLKTNFTKSPFNWTCENPLKNPVTGNVFDSFNLQQSQPTTGLPSDKYDPFMSAKRQLEELFSPTHPNSSSTPTTEKANTMSKSLTLKSPLNTSTTPIKTTSFRRTSSLRIPKKAPKPLLYIPTYKPVTTIQRGISDEGPISSNFLKPEEYDELPVKGHVNSPPDIIPRSLSRSSSRSRESSPIVVKRDQNSNVNRRNLKLEINKPNAPSDYPLSKTDSLAAFLKYENDLSCSPGLTEKERKDQSNSLNKQTSLKNSFAELLESKIDRGSVSPQEQVFVSKKYSSIKLEPLDHSFIERTNNLTKATQNTDFESSFIDPDLINDCDNLSVSRLIELPKTVSSSDVTEAILNTRSSDSVNSNKMRNSAEKRTLKRSLKLNKENFLYDTSPVSGKDSQIKDFTQKQHNETISSPPLRSSESFNKLRNNECIDALFDDFDFDEFISSFEDDEQYPIFKGYKELISNRSMNKLNKSDSSSASSTTSVEKSEEISSPTACDNDLMPLPKNNSLPYPVLLKSRNDSDMVDSGTQVTHRGDVPTRRLEVDLRQEDTRHDDVARVEDAARHVDSGKDVSQCDDLNNSISQAEKELLQSVQELNLMCTPHAQNDSDEHSSTDRNDKDRRSADAKLSGDSAYGSLSRCRPQYERPVREQSCRQRQHVFQIPDIVTSKRKPYQTASTDNATKRQPSNSLSSSGSESSLPPIVSRKSHESNNNSSYNKEAPTRNQEMYNNNGYNRELPTRLSKFCHGCGNRFTLEQAKFCMECGIKRIVLE